MHDTSCAMEPKYPHRKPNLLVVDDTPANLTTMEAVLSGENNLVLARSGSEAISTMEKRKDIDVVLMDVQMPGMDGFEAASRIKKIDGCQEVPIIFITAVYSEDAFVKRGYEVGGIDYFSKPFDPGILKLKVAIYASFRIKAELLLQRELHLRESEELRSVGHKLSAVLESLPIGVLIADVEGRICQTTEAADRLLTPVALSSSTFCGQMLGWWGADGQILKDDDGPVGRALRLGESTRGVRLELRDVQGVHKSIIVSVSPLRSVAGPIIGAVILIQDLTEPKRIEAALEERVTRLISLGVELEESVARAASSAP